MRLKHNRYTAKQRAGSLLTNGAHHSLGEIGYYSYNDQSIRKRGHICIVTAQFVHATWLRPKMIPEPATDFHTLPLAGVVSFYLFSHVDSKR